MLSYKTTIENIYIVGCGGVASWLLPVLLKLVKVIEPQPTIVLVDGDKLEAKNLDRQLFSPEQIGESKAEALYKRYRQEYPNMKFKSEYFYFGLPVERDSMFFVCVDNFPARKAVLQTVDVEGGMAILAGNEYTDSEAYAYENEWKDSSIDPRVYYPEINTDNRNDPIRPASCQGEAAIQTPQLVLANSSAANHALQLFWFHVVERKKLDKKETFDYWPILHKNTFSRFSSYLIRDKSRSTKTTQTAPAPRGGVMATP